MFQSRRLHSFCFRFHNEFFTPDPQLEFRQNSRDFENERFEVWLGASRRLWRARTSRGSTLLAARSSRASLTPTVGRSAAAEPPKLGVSCCPCKKTHFRWPRCIQIAESVGIPRKEYCKHEEKGAFLQHYICSIRCLFFSGSSRLRILSSSLSL